MPIIPATSAHVPEIHRIYAHWVAASTATFEIDPPSLQEIERRLRAVQDRGLPFLVATEGESVVAYAYAAPFRDRAAYDATVEHSVYVDPRAQRRGAGRALMAGVIDAAARAGKREMIAVVGDAERNEESIRFHVALGFVESGRLRAVGFKLGRWLDVAFLQLSLATPISGSPGRGSEDPGEP